MADRSSRFWDRIAPRYAKSPVRDEAAYRKKLDVTREYLRSDMTVLEIGCGTGTTAIAHAPYVAHVRAIDISAKMLEIARDKAEAAGTGNVEFERSTVDDLVVADASVDAVLALNVLHLLDDRDAAIVKVYRMLKPGGVFVSSTICMGDTMKFFKFLGPIGEFVGLLPHLSVFTTSELEDDLARAGFEIDHRWQAGKALFAVAKKSS